jgi:hypothetical protein
VHTSNERVFGQSMNVVDIGAADKLCPFSHLQEDIIELPQDSVEGSRGPPPEKPPDAGNGSSVPTS